MATITPAAVFPVAAPFNTSPSLSGTFIPTVWSSKLNAKFYAATVMGEITNNDWEGDVKNLGDKVIINNIPDIAISNYTAGSMTPSTFASDYSFPTPSTLEMVVDKGKKFTFQLNDVLAYQAQPNLLDMFSNDAAQQMKIAIDSTVIYNTFAGAVAANVGATAGVKSGAYGLGTPAAPVTLSGANILQILTSFAGVLDEQNVPETDRFLIIDPVTRQLLMQSNLAQAQFMGDDKSMVRNGKIGTIDRFTVYVSNQLPRAAANGTNWISGDGTETSATIATNAAKRRVLIAGHKSAICFASQMAKMETVRNPYDFGDLVRGLNIYGYKVVKPESLSYAVVA